MMHRNPPARFSLRTTLLVLTAVVVLLGATAPWVRQISQDQRRAALAAALGLLVGVGGTGVVACSQWSRAMHLGGEHQLSLAIVHAWLWRLGGAVFVLLLPAILLSGLYRPNQGFPATEIAILAAF